MFNWLYQFLNRHSLALALGWLIILCVVFYPARLPAPTITPAINYAFNFLVFGIGIIIFHNLLKLLRIHTIYVFWYALFPAFVYFSRTLMFETYSATLIMAVVYFLWQEQISPQLRWGFLAGMTAGLAVLVAYTNIIPLILIFLVLYLPALHRHNFKDILVHLAGVVSGILPWAVIILVRASYGFVGEEITFIPDQLPLFLLQFAGILSLFYPIMLELPLLIRTRLSVLIVPVIGTMVFYAGVAEPISTGNVWGLLLSLHFLVPIIPLLLIMYASSLHKFEERRWFKAFMVLGIVILASASLVLSYQHQLLLLS